MLRESKNVTKGDNTTRPWAIGSNKEREYWEKKYAEAISFMEERSSNQTILIEVASQHPLIEGKYPNEEFSKRLLLAANLFSQETETGSKVEIYVPGSVHIFDGHKDKISLSEAGNEFLIQLGISPNLIRGDDLNQKYKGDDGVYNSADECFVAANYFKDMNFGKLYSVVSPVQIFRKTLHYMEFGVLPMNFTAPTRLMYHNYISEIFEAIPYVLFVDHDLQGINSIRAKELRKIRKPNY